MPPSQAGKLTLPPLWVSTNCIWFSWAFEPTFRAPSRLQAHVLALDRHAGWHPDIVVLSQASHPAELSTAAGGDWLDSRRVARHRTAAAASAAAKAAAAQELLERRALETANPERAAAVSSTRSVLRCRSPLSRAGLL